MGNDFDIIVCEIVLALKIVLTELFDSNEKFYYCTFLTTGKGLLPLISAWSEEVKKVHIKMSMNMRE